MQVRVTAVHACQIYLRLALFALPWPVCNANTQTQNSPSGLNQTPNIVHVCQQMSPCSVCQMLNYSKKTSRKRNERQPMKYEFAV